MSKPLRTVKSFVKRQGRLTTGQKQAYERYWPLYGLEFTAELCVHKINFATLFHKAQPVILEIGFGNGDSLVQQAKTNTEENYLGIEVHQPGIGHCLQQVAEQSLTNLKLMRHDAMDVVNDAIASNSLRRVQIFFPDPWPKKKHHKRRLLQSEFVKWLVAALQPGGHLHVATDWQGYAEHTLQVLEKETALKNLSSSNTYVQKPNYRLLTKFEQRGLELGHGVYDIVFAKQ